MVNQIIAAGLQYQNMNFANQYAAAVIGQVKSIQEMVGSETVEMIKDATTDSVQRTPVDPNVGQNIDVVV